MAEISGQRLQSVVDSMIVCVLFAGVLVQSVAAAVIVDPRVRAGKPLSFCLNPFLPPASKHASLTP